MPQFVKRHGRLDLGDLTRCLKGAHVVIVAPWFAVFAREDQRVPGLACHQLWVDTGPMGGIENTSITGSHLPDSGRRAQPAPLNKLRHHPRDGL